MPELFQISLVRAQVATIVKEASSGMSVSSARQFDSQSLINCHILQSQPAQIDMLLLAAGNGQGVGSRWYEQQCWA